MFELILGMLGRTLLKVGESFVSKVVEQTADNALNNARKREVEEWLERVKSFAKEVGELGSEVESQGFIERLVDGGIASKLNVEIDKLVEQSRNFGELVLDCGDRGETLLTNGMVGEAFGENCETILKLLETRQVSSIGIYGMGGVGKTTLTKHIHNQLLQQYEGCVFWVTVSQNFTIKELQDTIARRLRVNLSNENNEDIRAARLHRALSGMKNSVLILDDVWEKIDLLKVGCPFSVECCRLIVTTRSIEICRHICCQKIIRVEKLCADEAWKLFNETHDGIEIGSEIENIAKLLANLCGGLPLAIVTVAGAMRGEMDIRTWKNALEDLRERVAVQDGEGGDEVFKILKYSFDRLNMNRGKESNEFNTLQLCFLYCSLYPEDYEMCRDDLVRQFISDGILDQRKRRESTDLCRTFDTE